MDQLNTPRSQPCTNNKQPRPSASASNGKLMAHLDTETGSPRITARRWIALSAGSMKATGKERTELFPKLADCSALAP